MKTSVVIVTSNFAPFIGQSIGSVLAQTEVPDEIIVVDDGSTDGTPDALRRMASSDGRIRLILQVNRGHLAALSRGIAETCGDILFLLDGDDVYEPAHVASCLQVFRNHPQVDLVGTAYKIFGSFEKVVSRHRVSGPLGSSAIAAMARRYWPVGPTSCLAIRRTLADRIFPYPDHWFSRHVQTGEAGLVLGASILGAREYFLSKPTVGYRAHDKNFDLARRHPAERSYRIMRLSCEIIEHFRLRAGLPADFPQHALAEFQTWASPGKDELKCYQRIIWQTRNPFFKRCEMVWRAYKHYWRRQ